MLMATKSRQGLSITNTVTTESDATTVMVPLQMFHLVLIVVLLVLMQMK